MTSRTAKDDRVTQIKLLVARFKGRYQEIHARIFQIPVEQGSTSEEIGRITSTGNITKIMIGNQY